MLIPVIAASSLALAVPGTPDAASSPPPFTTVPPLFYSEIVRKADVVVSGTVLAKESRYHDGRATIRTHVELGQLTFHKGQPQPALTLRFEGGTIGSDRLVVSGMPDLQVGRRYLLYVDGTRHAEKLSPIVGFHQGCFEFARRDGREVLLDTAGRELVGVRDDRFVFAARERGAGAPRPDHKPGIVLADDTVEWADPNADAIEARQLTERLRNAQRQQQQRPLAELPAAGRTEEPRHADGSPSVGSRAEPRDRNEAVPLVLRGASDTGARMSAADLLNTLELERR